jgi:hypothetical protein
MDAAAQPIPLAEAKAQAQQVLYSAAACHIRHWSAHSITLRPVLYLCRCSHQWRPPNPGGRARCAATVLNNCQSLRGEHNRSSRFEGPRITSRCRWRKGTARWSGCSCRAGIQTWQVRALFSADVLVNNACGKKVQGTPPTRCNIDRRSPTGLIGEPPRRGITLEEVKQHSSREDAWLAVNGKVGAC